MNTNMKELNLNDLDLVTGGGSCLGTAAKRFVKMSGDWIADNVVPACKDSAKAARNITKAALRQVLSWLN